MALERAIYRPRQAERGVLHAVVRTHLETFLHEAAHRADGAGLPQFVEQEFREFLTCGVLAHGFARLRCLCRAVLGVFVRALLDFYRRQARQPGVPDGHTGTLTVIQRFGGGLNLNVHFHTLVLD